MRDKTLTFHSSYTVNTRRFYLTGDMTNLHPFIKGWLE